MIFSYKEDLQTGVGILCGFLIALLAHTGPCMRYDGTTTFGRYGVHGKEE